MRKGRFYRWSPFSAEIADKARVDAVSLLSLLPCASGHLLPVTSDRVAAPIEKKGLLPLQNSLRGYPCSRKELPLLVFSGR